MSSRHSVVPSLLLAVVAVLIGGSRPLAAQTSDNSRLTLGVFAGWIGPQSLWTVPEQPVFSSEPGLYDPTIYRLHREVRSDISLGGHMSYFGSPHFGFVGEFTFLGLGNTDGCSVVQDGGDPELRQACTVLEGQQVTSSATTVQGGIIIRPFAHTAFQPYLSALAGVAFTPSSMIHMESVYGQIADTTLALTIYEDPDSPAIRPSWTTAFGIATAPSSGYQIRLEARETWTTISEVTGATSAQGFIPPHRNVFKAFPSIMVGFDVVLQKARGRRY